MTARHRLPLLLLAGSLLAGPAGAGSVEVTVRDREGRPVVDQKMVLVPLSALRHASRHRWLTLGPFTEIEPTDGEGRAIFPDVGPGTYTADVFGRPRDPELVKPGSNPEAPAPVVTLEGADDHGRLEVVLWRGVAVRVEAASLEGEPIWRSRAVFRHLATDLELTSGFDSETSVERVLPPGSWEIAVEAPAGFETVRVERDGGPLETSAVRLDLAAEPWPTTLAWTFDAPGIPDGVVTVSDLHPEEAPLTVHVRTQRTGPASARVALYPLAEARLAVRAERALGRRGAGFFDLPPGDYLVVATHRDFLEGRAELRGWTGEERRIEVVMPDGATIRLQALDLDDRPVSGLEVGIERLGEDPEVQSHDRDFAESKRRRVEATDHSGWLEVWGLYPGRYHVRPRLRGTRAARSRVYLGLSGGELFPELEVVLDDAAVELEARVVPAR